MKKRIYQALYAFWKFISQNALVSTLIGGIILLYFTKLTSQPEKPPAPIVKKFNFDRSRKGSLKVIILPFKGDLQTHAQRVIAKTLRNMSKKDSLDIDVREIDIELAGEISDSTTMLLEANNADILVWGDISEPGDSVFYTVEYRTVKWPELKNPNIEYKPFIMAEVSSGNINGSLADVSRYLQAITLYYSIGTLAETQINESPDTKSVGLKVNKAISIFNALMKSKSLHSQLGDSIQVYLANAYQFLRNNDSAIFYYKNYLARNPEDSKANHNLAVAYFQSDKFDSAIYFIDLAIHKSNNSNYKFQKGMMFYWNTNYREAASIFEALEKSYEPKFDLYFYWGSCWKKIGNFKVAHKYADKSLIHQPTQKGYALKAAIYDAEEEYVTAYDYLRLASRMPPANIELYFKSLEILQLSNRPLEIINVATEMMFEFPKRPELYVYRGIAHLNVYSYDLAIRDFSNSITLDTTYAEAYLSRSRAYKLKGNHDKAISDSLRYIYFKNKRPIGKTQTELLQ